MKSFKIAVISDTHVPDRTPDLEDLFLEKLKNENYDLILHAGDICVMGVITKLEKIAPVLAVRGNRDILLRRKIPMVQKFEKYGVKIALMHGHMDFITYWVDKLLYIFKGYERARYVSRLEGAAPGADVYIYGHTHHAENLWQNGVLYFNPGSITYGDVYTKNRTWGILEVGEDGSVASKILSYE